MIKEELRQAFAEYFENKEVKEQPVFLDGHAYDNSIVGITKDNNLVYDYDKMIEEFASDEECSEEEAQEWVDYNTMRAIGYASSLTKGARAPYVVGEDAETDMERDLKWIPIEIYLDKIQYINRSLFCWKDKQAFIQKIDTAIKQYRIEGHSESLGGVEEVNYEVYALDTPTGFYIKEYLVVHYRGGAIAVRNVSANSIAAIMGDFNKLMYGGYYEEVDTYKEFQRRIATKEVQRII